MRKLILPLLPFFTLVAVAEFLVQNGYVASYILPPPSAVFLSFVNDFSEYVSALQQTLGAAVLGLFWAGIAGVLVALLLASSDSVEAAFYPYATFFQTVPIISVAPLLVIWFGFGFRTVVISSFIVSVFPVIANTTAGLKFTDPALVDLFRLYGASRRDLLFKLRLPGAVPQIFTGLKISAGLAMIGAVIGEFITGGGLGGVIDEAKTQQRLDKVFAAVLLASFSGIILLFLLNVSSKILLKRWRELR